VAPGSSRRLSTLAQPLPLLQRVPIGWNIGEVARRTAPAGEGSPQEERRMNGGSASLRSLTDVTNPHPALASHHNA
jgi:hypothetical protein